MDYDEEIGYEPLELQDKKRKRRIRVMKGLAICLGCLAVLTFAIMIYNLALQTQDNELRSPKLSLQCSYQEDGFFIVNIIDADVDAGVTSSYYYLEDGNGTQILEICGSVDDIYELNMAYAAYNISFADNDSNGGIGPGDHVIIRSVEGGGAADEGYTFRLRFGPTGDTMGKVRLSK